MGDVRYKRCKGCGKSSADTGTLSWTRLCGDCGRERYEANILELHAHHGPFFQHWRRSSVAAYGGVLLDDVPGLVHGGGDGN